MNAKQKAQQNFRSLDFDFRGFSIDRFKSWIEERWERKIFLLGVPLTPDIDGFWVSDAEFPYEYVVFDNSVPPLHQVHIQLHELAHLISGHQTAAVTTEILQELLLSAQTEKGITSLGETVLHRQPRQKEQDEEAEALALLIQEHVISVAGVNQLVHNPYGNVNAVTWLAEMGLV